MSFSRSKTKTLHERIPLEGLLQLPSVPQIAKVCIGKTCSITNKLILSFRLLLCLHNSFADLWHALNNFMRSHLECFEEASMYPEYLLAVFPSLSGHLKIKINE